MNFTCIFFGLLFLSEGLLIFTGKGHKYLSVWKDMPPAERENINIIPLCRNIGGLIIINGGIFLLKGFWAAFSNRCFVWAMILWMIAAAIDAWQIPANKKYIKSDRS